MRRLNTGLSMLVALGATQAVAQVTPDEVWDRFQRQLETAGYAVEARESVSGGTLTLSDLTLRLPLPDADGVVQVVMDAVILADEGDTVAMRFPPVATITGSFVDDGEQVDLLVEVRHEGLDVTASGTPEAMVFDYDADTISVALESLALDGAPAGRDTVRAVLSGGAMEGRTVSRRGDGMIRTEQTLSQDDLRYDFAFRDPDTGEAGTLAGSIAGLTFDGTTDMPEGVDMQDFEAAVAEGFAFDGRFDHSGGQLEFSFTEDGGTTNGQARSDGGSFALAMAGDRVEYDLAGQGTEITLSGPDIPVPVSVGIAESAFGFSIPTQPGDAPQDASFRLRLGDLTVTEMLWSMVDPAGVLPRDPATIALDISARVSPLVDLFDPAAMSALEGEDAPADLNALTLRDLRLEAAGGVITGQGAFTFDNSDMQTFDGIPRPEGAVDFRVQGAEALLDRLIAMGLMTEEDAMGARMMIAMFTVPGSEPDTATSRIEIDERGRILANGQRIQ